MREPDPEAFMQSANSPGLAARAGRLFPGVPGLEAI